MIPYNLLDSYMRGQHPKCMGALGLRHLVGTFRWGWAVAMLICAIIANADLLAGKYARKETQDTWNNLWTPHWSWHVWLTGIFILAFLTAWEAIEKYVQLMPAIKGVQSARWLANKTVSDTRSTMRSVAPGSLRESAAAKNRNRGNRSIDRPHVRGLSCDS
jgi:hypothetical protein